jgi:hypothetical protein
MLVELSWVRGGGFRAKVRSWGSDLRRPGGEMFRSSDRIYQEKIGCMW